jgi:hypothetical protein
MTFPRHIGHGLSGVRSLAAAACLLAASPAGAQALFDPFRSGPASSFAPVDDGTQARPAPLSIIPVLPAPGQTPARRAEPVTQQAPSPAAPRAVTVSLPPPRPAGFPRANAAEAEASPPAAATAEDAPAAPGGFLAFLFKNAAGVPGDPEADAHDVIPLEDRRPDATSPPAAQPRRSVGEIIMPRGAPPRPALNSAGEELPPGVSAPGLFGQPQPPRGQRFAALPRTQASFSPGPSRPDLSLRPESLRETEHAVAGMPGVFADEDATFDCLPAGLKQVLVDVAGKFGHVAILNARRDRGTGARQSYHYQCRAVDFRVRGVALGQVMAFLREHPNVGGRKLYPFGFFHVDDGPVRSW